MIPENIVKFAKDNLGVYKMFQDYYNHYRSLNGSKNLTFSEVDDQGRPITFAEKENLINAALKKEIMRVAGIQNFDQFALEQWVTNPMLNWATFAVVSAMVDMVLPDVLWESFGLFTDVKNIGFGDSAVFDVKSNGLYSVSRAGRSQRITQIHKDFESQISIVPEPRQISTAVSMMKVLSGHENLASYTSKIALSLESQIAIDCYNAFVTLSGTIPATATTGLRVSGYSEADLRRIAAQVEAWSRSKPVVVGTSIALSNVLPDTDVNYRWDLGTGSYGKLGYWDTPFGYSVLALPNIADHSTEWARIVSDSYLWILAPASGKLLKLVFEGSSLSNTDSYFDNANLLSRTTLIKSWGVGVVTNNTMGVITL